MKVKKAASIIIKIMCIAVLIMICLVAAFFVPFNGGHLDSLINTDTLGEVFFNGDAASRVIDCDVTQKNADGKTYGDCKLGIPVEKHLAGDS